MRSFSSRVPEVVERALGELGHQLDGLARLHEHDRPRALDHQLGEQVGGLRERAAPGGELLVGDRRVPHRDRASAARRAVVVDHGEVVEAGEPLGQLARVGDRGAGEHEAGARPVGVRDAPEPAQHVADVGAEHAAVDVRLVDHHQREVGEEVAPRAVVGEDPQVQHVRVGEDDVGAAADLQALLPRRVAVVDRVAQAVDPEGVQRARLVLRERLGRVQVQRARLGVAAQHVERRELEAQRLPGRGAGGHDRRAGPRGVQRLGLVRVQPLDPAALQRFDDARVQLLRDADGLPGAAVLGGRHHQPLVLAAGLQELVPGLDVAYDRHPLRY